MWLSPTPIPLGAGLSEGDCYIELPRIPIPRTPVNKGNKEGWDALTPALRALVFCLSVKALAYR